jgi:hypothetical protein
MYGRRKSPAVIRGLAAASLRSGVWYWSIHCACGREVLVTEDPTSGVGGDCVHLNKPVAVACECGALTLAWRFKKLKTI